MKKVSAHLLIVFFVLLVSSFCYFFLEAKNLKAANAVPAPGRIPCDPSIQKDPEFHSDRPYQASPCSTGDGSLITYWCGNSVKMLLGTQKVEYCDKENGQKTSCPIDRQVGPQTVAVDLTDVEVPILGNTQLVKNSQNASETLDDASKVSNYVSWYLNGATDIAENTTSNTTDNLINLSGPIQKLAPKPIIEGQRVQSINTIYEKSPQVDENDEPTGQEEGGNHNQIVVCYKKQIQILPNWLTDIFGVGAVGLGKAVPQDCYDGNGGKAKPTVLRLSSWDKTGFDVLVDAARPYLEKVVDQGILGNLLNQALVEHWNSKIPPLPWADENGKPFESEDAYRKAYNEWRGNLCAYLDLPIIGKKLICVGVPGVTDNDYATLFTYVPLANTVDKKGAQYFDSFIIRASGGVSVENPVYSIEHSPQLYFGHAKENYDLTNLLISTYAPQDLAPQSASTENLRDVENNKPTQGTKGCKIIPSRSNPGDDATFDDPKSRILVTSINYHLTGEVNCTNIKWHEDSQEYSANCSTDVTADIPMTSKTPYANEIWNNTVAGNDSVFRRIYPKTGRDTPVSCIADVPAVSDAVYRNNGSSAGVEIQNVTEPDNTVIKNDSGSDSVNAHIYYPHYGGVFDYFIKGIQVALRPKGYGGEQVKNGSMCDNVSDNGDCSWNMDAINKGINDAAAKYNVPASLLHAIFQIEMADEINNPSLYQCTQENSANAIGVAQVTRDTYEDVTCDSEQMDDVGMCGTYSPKLSRCNFSDAFELMARVLLLKAGCWNSTSCKPTCGISESDKMTWYNASCNYYGSFSPDALTTAYAQEIPADQKRTNGDMNYCDIVCWEMGQCPAYP